MTSAPSLGRYAWLVVMLLWPVALLNYMDRQMMAAMKFSIMDDLPSIGSEANWGLLPAVFKWVYAFVSPFGGYLADRFSKRHVIVTSLFVWSAVTWATGHAQTFEQLVWSRALMGISEACYIPAALALITDYHNGPTRSRAIGTHQMAIYAGVMIGGFSGYAADSPSLGWRWAFDAAGIAGVLYALPLFFLLRNPPATGEAMVRPSPGRSLGELLGNRFFILLVLYFTLPALAGWVVRDWMPAILKDQFGIGQGHAGVSATLYVNLTALIAVVLGGVLADRWMKRTIRGRIYISAIGVGLIIPALFGVGNAATLGTAIAFLIVYGLGWGFFDCNNMPILCQIVRPELRATGYGLMNFVSISCGGFADWGFGIMRDQGIPLNLIFTAFAALCAISVGLVLAIRPKATV
ncbi:MFS transporter [Luteolibacter sp. SL250]|uniref:MFS transporter n=1 Tax=Luteolibacter sp. SL250 TaxID=2995170 RepID=UPI00226FE8DB|nr:MFS transporter [Luteolibacter sp. SL250]WAC18442.1 MFS transporter [Luteolibacter sp. SL250]